jgi:hypothetical protein
MKSINDYHDIMSFVISIWYGGKNYIEKNKNTYRMHTVGWSGNEDIMRALISNHMFWLFYWKKSERGGHYVFSPMGE